MFCQYCGNELKSGTKFCPSCGASINEETKKAHHTQNTSANNTNTNSNSFTGNDSLACIAYITWIGFFIALIMNKDVNNEFVNFHLNQALILNIGFLISAVPIIGWLISIVIFIFWIMAIISAIQKKTTPLPLIGDIHIIY